MTYQTEASYETGAKATRIIGDATRVSDGFTDITPIQASVDIPFGRVVSRKTDGKLALGGAKPLGICEGSKGSNTGGTDNEVKANYTAPVKRKGYMAVAVKKSVAIGGAVYYDSTTGELGLASGDTNAVAFENAEYQEAGSAGAIVEIRIDN